MEHDHNTPRLDSPLHLSDDVLCLEPLWAAVKANVIDGVVVALGQQELRRVSAVSADRYR